MPPGVLRASPSGAQAQRTISRLAIEKIVRDIRRPS
jgi:hypothetical protein